MNNKPSTPKRNRVWNKESGYWVSADNYISFGQRILGRVDLNIYSEKKIGHLKKQHEEDIEQNVRLIETNLQLREQLKEQREKMINKIYNLKQCKYCTNNCIFYSGNSICELRREFNEMKL